MKQQQKFNLETCPNCEKDFLAGEKFQEHKENCEPEPEPEPEPDSEDSDSKPEPTEPSTVQKLPVNRDYDFSQYVPTETPDYKESNQELTRILADIENREVSGQLARYLISGDTGAGKTHLAEVIAESRNSPMFTIQGKYSMDESDLLGSPVLVNGKTVWTDGTLTKALLASQEQEVVLLVDELNRARPESKGVLFSALDDRCRVELDARGGEVIEGDPENLIVIGTINEGTDFEVQPLDKAEKRRFGRKFEVEHLGRNHPDKEAEVVSSRTPVSEPVARSLVDTANEIRDSAGNQASVVDTGVPTSSLLDWARTAFAYNQAGVGNPVVESGRDTVVRPIFDSERVRQEVTETVKDHLDDAPVEEDRFREWSENPEQFDEKTCSDCGRSFSSKRGVSLHQTQSECGE